MNLQTLNIISKLRHLSQTDISRMAGVSRQAVSLWFKKRDTHINMNSQHLQKLAEALHIGVNDLLTPLPYLNDPTFSNHLKTAFLWDRLYPTVEDFMVALVKNRERALARLVEVYGLFRSASVFGKPVWTFFQKYKKFLPPVRRKQCEQLWLLQKNLNLI